MAKDKVSADFMRIAEKKANKLQEVKKAENTSRGIPLPVGTTGKAVLSDFVAGVSKGKNKNPYIRIEAKVMETTEGDKHQGKTISKFWSFYDSDGASYEDRWGYFLNDMENMGLPRNVREEDGDDPNALAEWVCGGDERIIEFAVIDGYKAGTKDVTMVALEAEELQTDEEKKAVTTSEDGKFCMYLDKKNEILEELEDGKIKIKSVENGRIRDIPKDKVKML